MDVFQTNQAYGGTQPPANSGRHDDHLVLFALNTESIDIPAPFLALEQFEAALSGKIIGKSEWVGGFTKE
ncbi:YbhB/YbcL family Raf kinase inhibitor-like protein [Ammoniphilus sp. 3BR4]|uniref:YbhB/YbcL family Raf kinase inhibitor-like protein n=1 Tax=Ammoniphilus sp. 3BR4 TaxID=3158265 RepID=UPI003465BCF1